MKRVQYVFTIYKEGEDVDLGTVRPLHKKVVDLVKESGFKARIEQTTVEEEDAPK